MSGQEKMKISEVMDRLGRNPSGVRFTELVRICNRYFGEPRKQSTNHRVYKTPWQGDPRVNVQDKKGMAKPCQVRQVMKALEKLAEEEDD